MSKFVIEWFYKANPCVLFEEVPEEPLSNINEAIAYCEAKNKKFDHLTFRVKKRLGTNLPGLDHVGISVAFLIIHPDDDNIFPLELTCCRAVFSKRGPRCRNEIGKWEFGGGGLELGETIEEAVRREAKEEYGLDIEVFCQDYDICEQFIEGQHWVCVIVAALAKDSNIQVSEPNKVIDPQWVKITEAIDNLDLSIATENCLKAMGIL